MSAAEPPRAYSIAYQRQSSGDSNRTCGAACLSMVYRSFDMDVPQTKIWPAIAKPNRFGSLASTTHLMVADALERGFDAVAIQARHPLHVLGVCRAAGIRVILNHRLHSEAGTGHYTVLVDLGDQDVTLHDPYFGPSRRLAHAELLELWQPRFPNSEIVGSTLIAIAARQPGEAVCEICRNPFPASVACPQCHKPVALRPAAPFGCLSEACVARIWNYVCCPSCDEMWAFDTVPPEAPAEAAGAARAAPEDQAESPWNFEPLFRELDKFCSAVMALPVAAANPEILQQLAFIAASKDKLTLAAAEELANQKAQQQKMAAVAQASEQRGEAHRRKMEEMNTPSPPLDGNALGQALLKNLGVPVDRGATAARPAVSDGTSRNLAVPGDRTSTGRRTIVRG